MPRPPLLPGWLASRAAAAVFGAALAIALPASVLTNASFRPVDARLQFDGQAAATGVFELTSRQPLFLEFDLVVRAPSDARPAAVFTLNDVEITTIVNRTLYVGEGARIALPIAAIREGENRLTVALGPPAGATFDFRARIQNYHGIAPDFPRAVVVPDAAVSQATSVRSTAGRLVRFTGFYAGSVIVVWLLFRAGGCRPGLRGAVLLASPAFLLWPAFFWTLATPLHVWLSVEALLVLALLPWVLTLGAIWIAAHPAKVLRVAAVVLVTAGLSEAALRAFNYVRPSFVFYSDSFGRYRGQPGAPHFDTQLNSRGFNDVERHHERPPGVAYRIVAIGDSFTFGVVPYRANYLTLVESDLSRRAPVEVIKIGVAGTEPRDYLAMLVEEGLAFTPDLVVVSFFIGNDFEARAKKPYEHSYVATLVHFLWRTFTARQAAPITPDAAGSLYDDEAPGLPVEQFLEVTVDRARIYSRGATGLVEAAARAAGYLGEMRDVARQAGAEFLVVLIPDEAQVDVALQDTIARATGKAPGDLDFGRPTDVIGRALAERDIAAIDLLPAFIDASPTTRLYKPRDTHWNLAGNRLAADVIGAALVIRLRDRLGAPPGAPPGSPPGRRP